jgi:hypothetical protein
MSDEKDNSQAPDPQAQPAANETPLAVQDVIVEEGKDIFNEYVSVSITSNGHDTTLSATTIEGEPHVYTATFHGITAVDLQSLISASGLDNDIG